MSDAPPPPCPICKRRPTPDAARLRPFCSKRCADLDLHRWLSGSYRIPTPEEPDPGEETPAELEPDRR